MSVLSTMLKTTFDVKRMATVTGSTTSSLQTISSGNRGIVRPIQNSAELFNVANWGKEYRLWCGVGIDIKPNDIVVSGGVTYGVDGVSLFEDIANSEDSHLRVIITKK